MCQPYIESATALSDSFVTKTSNSKHFYKINHGIPYHNMHTSSSTKETYNVLAREQII